MFKFTSSEGSIRGNGVKSTGCKKWARGLGPKVREAGSECGEVLAKDGKRPEYPRVAKNSLSGRDNA